MIKNNDLNSTRMKQNRIITLSVAVALVFAISIPAEAQFGNVLKNAKRNVERKVKNKAETSVDRTTDKAMNKAEKKVMEKTEEKTGLPVSESSNNNSSVSDKDGSTLISLYKKDYEPSKEAIENDPDASNNDVWKRSTRSFAQIHAAYEHLDPKYFPLQPYYKYPKMYGLGDNLLIGHNVLNKMIEAVLSQRPGDYVYFPPFIHDDKNGAEFVTRMFGIAVGFLYR